MILFWSLKSKIRVLRVFKYDLIKLIIFNFLSKIYSFFVKVRRIGLLLWRKMVIEVLVFVGIFFKYYSYNFKNR